MGRAEGRPPGRRAARGTHLSAPPPPSASSALASRSGCEHGPVLRANDRRSRAAGGPRQRAGYRRLSREPVAAERGRHWLLPVPARSQPAPLPSHGPGRPGHSPSRAAGTRETAPSVPRQGVFKAPAHKYEGKGDGAHGMQAKPCFGCARSSSACEENCHPAMRVAGKASGAEPELGSEG